MERQELVKNWKLLWNSGFLETEVPFSMYGDLLKYHQIGDPYYRDNEKEAYPYSREDCRYQTEFDVSEKLLNCRKIWLRFEGIDTLADIILNGVEIGSVFNMHRVWEFSVEKLLKLLEAENV